MTHLVFDFDGTLHDTIKIYAPAFRKVYGILTDKGLAQSRKWTDREIGKWLGYSSRDMWNAFMPHLPEDEKKTCSRIIGKELILAIQSGEAQLYEGAEETLRQLKMEGYGLVFLSNCKIDYMRESIRHFALERFFNAFYCTEQYGFAPKNQIFKGIAKAHTGNFVIIGDRETDARVAKENGLPFIGCAYGYGTAAELEAADGIAYAPAEITTIIKKLGV